MLDLIEAKLLHYLEYTWGAKMFNLAKEEWT